MKQPTNSLASGDHPKQRPGGDVSSGSEALTQATGGGGPLFSNRQSLWQILANETDELAEGELVGFIQRLDESPAFRRGQVAELLGSLKQRLDSLPEDQPGDSPQELPTGDLVLIAHLLLRHQA